MSGIGEKSPLYSLRPINYQPSAIQSYVIVLRFTSLKVHGDFSRENRYS
jgi:hypothetical protein